MYELGYDGSHPSPHMVPVYAPPRVAPKLLGLIGPGSAQIFRTVFDFKPISQAFVVGDMSFSSFRVVHPTETYGLAITSGDKRIVYTSDTASFPELADHCRDADLLVCEATYVGDVEVEPGVHMWAREAGELAKASSARSLVLTHIWASFDPNEAVREASAIYDGPVEAAVEGKTYRP
jgi:ribonuclease BN (tRNA processing enzyme)